MHVYNARLGAWLRLATCAFAVTLTACGDSPSESVARVPARLDVVSGNTQEAVVGTELPEPLVVRVTDDRGKPLAGQVVNFRVVSGGGSVFAGTAQTNAQGEARERWTLGTSTAPADSQRVEVRAVDPTTGAAIVFGSFNATAKAGAAAEVVPLGSPALTSAAGTTLADSVAVRVLDRFRNPVPGQSVTWSVTAGGGTVDAATSTTNSAGVARAAWTLGTRAGDAQTLSATAGSLPAATLTATVTSGPAAAISRASVDGGTFTVNASRTLLAKVVDRYGNPVRGAQVSWTVESGGGKLGAATTTTDAGGFASVGWNLGTVPGQQAASAAIAGAEGSPATYTATAVAGPPEALRFRVHPTDSRAEVPISPQVQVELLDAYGNLSTSGSYSVMLRAAPTSTIGWIKESPTSTHVTTVSSGGVVLFSTVSIRLQTPQQGVFRLVATMFHPSGTGNFSAESNSFNVTP
ncbi:MAG TPA: Ig-like domain-containing protein [Longimicrobium sp.]